MSREKAKRAAKLAAGAAALIDQAVGTYQKALDLIDDLRSEADGDVLLLEAIDSVMDADDVSPEPHLGRAEMFSLGCDALAEAIEDALAEAEVQP